MARLPHQRPADSSHLSNQALIKLRTTVGYQATKLKVWLNSSLLLRFKKFQIEWLEVVDQPLQSILKHSLSNQM